MAGLLKKPVFAVAVLAIAALTVASGLVVALRMPSDSWRARAA